MKQTIPNAIWTKVEPLEIMVFQNSGAHSWVDVGESRQIVFGPADSWSACQYSGDMIDLDGMTPGLAVTVDVA